MQPHGLPSALCGGSAREACLCLPMIQEDPASDVESVPQVLNYTNVAPNGSRRGAS